MPYQVPSRFNRIAIVTGADTEPGRAVARALAAAGATVTLAVPDPARGDQIRRQIMAAHPGAELCVRRLDMSDLSSVRGFAAAHIADGLPVHMLINLAEAPCPLTRVETADGFELQMATNFLSAHALIASLLPALLSAPSSRIVTGASRAARRGRIVLDDVNSERSYHAADAYAASKLAGLLLTQRLARISTTYGWPLLATSARPGSDHAHSRPATWDRPAGSWLTSVRANLLPEGQLVGDVDPVLHAAAAPDVTQGGHYGTTWPLPGPPRPEPLPDQARDEELAEQLCAQAEQLTGVSLTPLT
ncbi:SDR family NAD(P)-dependent oxidoreductase [Leucobacter weissii]|uniref:SDR family NAD(P)-dependent oxidoreductase n=1 Tax=Leucobacter weissii TaxID=1983706 RepID=A0A939MK61_9MICO|nr:SDR family NAD(P)-dependent oxidoreductase [Leucobacter weissii]MBO1902474.1 SDR family NAD(P)-dependent oxidoreductase [Leucobacter weissii]